ncbi:MAG TPA: TetR/AcrR family transcriptional regulator [Steroidobacteraceae bacterium]|nr:TetR/AcrR family transcriptional regulator [Steroidobacteraceae bacterium]
MNYIAERRLEEKDRRRNEILDAAESVAAVEGIEALTMDHVARKARISRALLYVYFKDKADLHFGLCERALALLLERFEQATARRGNGLEHIIAIGRAYVAFAAEFPVHFEALARFQAQEVDGAAATANLAGCFAGGQRVHEIMFAAIEAGQRDGSIAASAGSPVAIAMTLWGFMHGIIQIVSTKAGLLGEYGLGSKALVDQALKLAADGLRPARG